MDKFGKALVKNCSMCYSGFITTGKPFAKALQAFCFLQRRKNTAVVSKSAIFAINSVSVFHCRALSPLCEPCTSHRVKGQITACGFVTGLLKFARTALFLHVKGQITACGFVTSSSCVTVTPNSARERPDYRLRFCYDIMVLGSRPTGYC